MEDIFPLSVGKIISGYRHWFIMVIELSGVQFGLKSYTWFQNRTHAARSFDLKSQVWFQTKIARHEVQLPLYYIPFEIDQIQDLVSSNILLMQHWAGLKLNLSILRGGGIGVLETKVAKFATYTVSFIFLQFDWLLQTSLEIWLVVLL